VARVGVKPFAEDKVKNRFEEHAVAVIIAPNTVETAVSDRQGVSVVMTSSTTWVRGTLWARASPRVKGKFERK